jgi:hypothetical protein
LPLAAKLVANNRRTAPSALALYDVRSDLSETREVSSEHPEVVRRLTALAESARKELGDIDQPGVGQRAAGYVAEPKPLLP